MKLNILFVDDEQSIISGLKRMLHFMKNEWNMYFALSGLEALDILEKAEMDIVISDMRMPGMDGATLLEKVKKLYPATVRIILSGYSDRDLILKASKAAHQFLAKPIDAHVLKDVIEQLYSLQNILKNPQIIKIANGVNALPSLPELFVLIEEEMRKPDPSIRQVENIISRDMIMTARILQLVNSAFFGLPQKIVSSFDAVNFLGIEVIKALVLIVHLFSNDAKDEPSSYILNKTGDESIKTANLCKEIAISEKLDNKIIEVCFIGGLLHNIGELIMWQISNYFADISKYKTENKTTEVEAEYALYGTSHAEVGAYLLGVWGLPDSLVKTVYYHHFPSKCPDKNFIPLEIVHAADFILNKEPLDTGYEMVNGNINKWINTFNKEQQYE